MAKIDDLNAAVVSLQTTTDAVLVKIGELQGSGNLDPQLEAATVAINEAVAKLNQAIS